MSRARIDEIAVPPKDFGPYQQFNNYMYDQVLAHADKVRGLHIVHINSTEKGGGVAELLWSQVALEKSLGINARWLVIRPGNPAFFDVTRRIHNLFQGGDDELLPEDQQIYAEESQQLSAALADALAGQVVDMIVTHDPQPYDTVAQLRIAAPKILRFHVDVQQPNPAIIDWLCRDVAAFTRVIVSREDCRLACLAPQMVLVIAPAIDPLTVKNQPLDPVQADTMIKKHGIDPALPLITQISRFDPWKDQVGVVAAYQQAKKHIPGLQLALVGFFQADDDPAARDYFQQVQALASDDPQIFLFSQLDQLKNTSNEEFIRAMLTASDVVLQKSIREGFGLTATEAMWKGKAVIGGDVGGIKLQIKHGINGWLVSTVADTAQAIVELLRDDGKRAALGTAARQAVADTYLISRYIRDNLAVYDAVQHGHR